MSVELCEPFFVPGPVYPKGSGTFQGRPSHCLKCKAYVPNGHWVEQADMQTKTRRSKSLTRWCKRIRVAADLATTTVAEHGDAVELVLTFTIPRPPSVKPNKRPYPTTKPDIDKLTRAVMDALADGVVFDQDSQVTDLRIRKRYADNQPAGVHVEARILDSKQEILNGTK